MTLALQAAALVAVGLAVAHSILGEVYILQRLFERKDSLPRLFGGTEFTERTLRFAWHLTSVAWLGFGAILLLMTQPLLSYRRVALVLAVVFIGSGLLTLAASRGRHLAWPAFLFVGVVALYTAYH